MAPFQSRSRLSIVRTINSHPKVLYIMPSSHLISSKLETCYQKYRNRNQTAKRWDTNLMSLIRPRRLFLASTMKVLLLKNWKYRLKRLILRRSFVRGELPLLRCSRLSWMGCLKIAWRCRLVELWIESWNGQISHYKIWNLLKRTTWRY